MFSNDLQDDISHWQRSTWRDFSWLLKKYQNQNFKKIFLVTFETRSKLDPDVFPDSTPLHQSWYTQAFPITIDHRPAHHHHCQHHNHHRHHHHHHQWNLSSVMWRRTLTCFYWSGDARDLAQRWADTFSLFTLSVFEIVG